jgi:anti-sigma factor RsiW
VNHGKADGQVRETHITRLLEEKALADLNEHERGAIAAHVETCAACLRAYGAARASSVLIKARAAETVEPSAFFKTRVMAALKERHLSPEPAPLVRMWRAAGALVSAMAALVVILIGLSIFTYAPATNALPEMSASQSGYGIYSPESVVFERDDLADDQAAYDLVLGTMYESEYADGK